MTQTNKQMNFSKALRKLESFLIDPIVTERDRAGLIQAFEFTFEQCWKTLQRIAQEEGFEANSPKKALEIGLTLGLLASEDETIWLQMLRDRNLSTHMYQELIAEQVSDRTQSIYVTMFKKVEIAVFGKAITSPVAGRSQQN